MFLRLYPTNLSIYIPIKPIKKINNLEEKMTLSPESLAGPGYIILNAVRVMNIIAFLAVITASVVMLVKTSTVSNFFFFDAVSHVVTAIISMFLVTSELSLFRPFFARNWPLLGPAHGFVTLAIAMIVLGVNVLGNLNKPAASPEELGLAIWRIVIGSGILVFILGFFNLIASYVFRDHRQGITARQVRAQGAVAVHKTPMSTKSTFSSPSFSSTTTATTTIAAAAPVIQQQTATATTPMTPPSLAARMSVFNPFKRMTKSYADDNNNTSHITPSLLPTYTAYNTTANPPSPDAVAHPFPPSPSSKYSRATNDTAAASFAHRPPLFFNRPTSVRGGKGDRQRESLGPQLPINVSAPFTVQRPDSALHPSRSVREGEGETVRWKC